MAHVIQLALGVFMHSRGVKGCTKSWEAHEREQEFGENESIDIEKSQRLHKEGKARINMVSAMWPGLATIIEKVCISRNFECPEPDRHIAANGYPIEYANTRSLKWVHWRTISESPNCFTTYHQCEVTVPFKSGVAWASIPITRIHLWVAREFTCEYLKNSPYSDYCPLFTTQDKWIIQKYVMGVLRTFRYWTLWMSKIHTVNLHHVCHCVQWHIPSYGWHYASFSKEKYSIEGRLILCRKVWAIAAVQILCWSYSNHRYASHPSSYASSFLDVAII